MSQTKNQQIQFFEDLLLPKLGVSSDKIDVVSLVDSELSTYENWVNNIKPKAEMLVDRGFLTKKELEAHIEKYDKVN